MSSVTPFPMHEREPAAEAGFALPGGDDDALNLRRLLSTLRRRKIMIAGVMAVITAIAWLLVNQLTPVYSTATKIVVQPDRTNLPIQEIVVDPQADYYTNDTEAEVIASRELGRKAVDRLNLMENPLFNPLLQTPQTPLVARLWTSARRFMLGFVADPEEVARVLAEEEALREKPLDPTAGMTQDERDLYMAELRENIVSAYLGGLSVTPAPRSRVITISYASTDPHFARDAANAQATVYILDQVSQKGDATKRVGVFLADRVNELRDRMIEKEREIADFQREVGLIDTGGITIYQQQFGELSQQLLEIKTKRTELEARAQQVQELLNAGTGVETSAAVLENTLIGRLREQEAQVSRKLAELRTRLRPEHPTLQQGVNELNDLRAAITREVDKIGANLKNELQIVRLREQALEAEVARLKSILDDQNDARGRLRALETELQANKQLYETFLERMRQTDILEQSEQKANARIISVATVPGAPYFPNKRLMLAAAIAFSAVIGIALAFVADFLDSGFRSASQLEAQTGVASLGMVPTQDRRRNEGKLPHEIALSKPNSTYGEAIRSLRTALMLSSVDRPPRTVLFTSAIPGEGKTSTSLSLATTAAKSGQKVIIVDCDLRHSNLHVYLGVPNRQGLSDYLANQAPLDDVIEIDPRSTVHYITAGSRAPNPTDMLNSDEMKRLIHRLSEIYDLVVLDTPPLLAVSDALVLVREVDKTVFVVRWEKTRRETSLAGLKMAIEAGADLAGTVLTQVDVKKHATYDYADSGYYYYGSYRKYYSE